MARVKAWKYSRIEYVIITTGYKCLSDFKD